MKKRLVDTCKLVGHFFQYSTMGKWIVGLVIVIDQRQINAFSFLRINTDALCNNIMIVPKHFLDMLFSRPLNMYKI